MDARATAVIFRKRILPWSETFIATQSGAMTRYAPVLVGYSRDPSGAAYLVGRPQLLLNEHSWFPALEKFLLKSAGRAPSRWLRAIAETKPAVLHAHFGSSALPASRIAKALRIPLVVTYHGMDITVRAKTEAEAARRRRAFAAADRVIAVSRFIADALRAAGCPDGKIRLHYIGVDTTRFTPGTAPRSRTEVLFVGRLVEKKGVIHLVRAMAEVRKSVPGAELVLAGDGPLREPLAREAAQLGVPATFLGVQTPEQVQQLMRRAAVLAGPSIADARGNAEGLPITFLEAQASGLPLVVSTSGGTGEGVVDGVTGFLFDPGDESALAGHLRTLLGDAALRERMSAAARAHMVTNFDLARQTAALEEIYDSVRA
ncbi:MAG: glycosyltransferase [Gemmatimonadetes bacterium]|nr:glycosyltransferase [Gemmatimonadota bacterium]